MVRMVRQGRSGYFDGEVGGESVAFSGLERL